MFGKLAELVLRRRTTVLVLALLLAVAGAAAGATLFDRLKGGGLDDRGAESGRAARVLEKDLGQPPPNLTLLVTAPHGVDERSAAAAGAALSRRLAAEPGISDSASYWTGGKPPQLRSKDGRKALVLATIRGDDTAVDNRLAELAPRYTGTRDGLEVKAGGTAMLQHEMVRQSEKDMVRGELVAFPLTLVLLVLVFGSVVAATLPLIVAVVTILVTMGVLWGLAGLTDVSVLAASVGTLLGLGLAIDYSLLVVSRYRDELRGGRPPSAAMRATLATAGRTVVFSAVTVAVALGSLAWFPLMTARSIASAGAVTALLAAFTSVTALPALLLALGRRIERGRLWRRGAGTANADGSSAQDRFWHALTGFVMRRPVAVAALVTSLLLLLGAPFLGIKVAMPDERVMPRSASSRQVSEVVAHEFESGEQSAVQVVVPRAGGGPRAAETYTARLSRLPNVARVEAAGGTYVGGARLVPPGPRHRRHATGQAAYLSVVPRDGGTDATARLVEDVRATPAPFPTLVGGTAAVSRDATTALVDGLPYAALTLVAAMLFLLFLLTRSVLLPIISLVLSALSLTATLGALVWIFQDGHLAGLLGGFTDTGTTAANLPVALFAIGFGLAMDYQMFLLSQIREEYETTGDATKAVTLGLARAGRIITAAAVLITVVFLAFNVSEVSYMKAFGTGLALAVLVDSTLVRGALVPAAMRLGGPATWWSPRLLRPIRPHAPGHPRHGTRSAPPHTRTPR
ncbi:MMPL family transporter [Actinomadura terrae]|uniref:MMPL family transporter n=1 Tax=Actinomadura terrae TaxID=604353 RepID=UPI001FA7F177|nr:MMPL family transporter [Actinomadura terrae]